ncbi:MAG: GNAT family N-acetyltransferase [Pseudomonadota bacterium]
MIIRRAQARDQSAIWGILKPVFRAGATYTIDPDITETDALEYWCSADKDTFVAEAESEVVGTYYIRPNYAGGGDHICNCGYVTGARGVGRGVARTMCAHSLEFAKTCGYRGMQFNFVVSANTRAVDLWERFGFEIVGRLPLAFLHPVEGYVDALVMYRAL